MVVGERFHFEQPGTADRSQYSLPGCHCDLCEHNRLLSSLHEQFASEPSAGFSLSLSLSLSIFLSLSLFLSLSPLLSLYVSLPSTSCFHPKYAKGPAPRMLCNAVPIRTEHSIRVDIPNPLKSTLHHSCRETDSVCKKQARTAA
jgi:hypothetical protein